MFRELLIYLVMVLTRGLNSGQYDTTIGMVILGMVILDLYVGHPSLMFLFTISPTIFIRAIQYNKIHYNYIQYNQTQNQN